ncbi:MAG: metal ABC transporter ATP-binding protein [Tissierellia bacterium]|nr:metal ABC transporter ATP-binding protein [Tissierellia bacterium]
MKKDVIKIEDLTIAYNENPVLWDIDLEIPENTRCAIIGPNGAGKSTLIKGILDLIKPISGSIRLWDKPLDQVRDRISYVPQTGDVNWDFPTTVFDVVLMGRYQKIGLFKRPSKEDKELALRALRDMKMEDFSDRQISQLSGGQRQRVFIARSLCQDADLYIMDEPLTGVDETTEKIIMDKFLDLQKNGKTVIAVHHDLGTIKEYFDYVVMLNKTVKVHGPAEETMTQANIERAYRVKE